MTREAKTFKVPDELANLYEFANSLDVRQFVHHGVAHPQSDELSGASGLDRWMSARGLSSPGKRVTAPMRRQALELRASLRAFLACEIVERKKDKQARRALNRAAAPFPMIAKLRNGGGSTLLPARRDALAGLSVVVAAMHMAAASGTLDRLKMCASDECRRIFFDRSKPGTRRWCLSTLCGNRMKTRAYRERQKIKTGRRSSET